MIITLGQNSPSTLVASSASTPGKVTISLIGADGGRMSHLVITRSGVAAIRSWLHKARFGDDVGRLSVQARPASGDYWGGGGYSLSIERTPTGYMLTFQRSLAEVSVHADIDLLDGLVSQAGFWVGEEGGGRRVRVRKGESYWWVFPPSNCIFQPGMFSTFERAVAHARWMTGSRLHQFCPHR